MKHAKLIFTVLSILAVTVTSYAAEAESSEPAAQESGSGTGVGGGGETIQQGKIQRLRDLFDKSVFRCTSGAAFASKLTYLPVVLSSIEKTHWYLADSLRREFPKLMVCFTRDELYHVQTEDLDAVTVWLENTNQVAVRVQNNVYIDQRLLEKMPEVDQAYFWIHETLHSYLPMWTSLRNTSLRSFNAILRENEMSPMTAEDFGEQIRAFHIDILPQAKVLIPIRSDWELVFNEKAPLIDRLNATRRLDRMFEYSASTQISPNLFRAVDMRALRRFEAECRPQASSVYAAHVWALRDAIVERKWAKVDEELTIIGKQPVVEREFSLTWSPFWRDLKGNGVGTAYDFAIRFVMSETKNDDKALALLNELRERYPEIKLEKIMALAIEQERMGLADIFKNTSGFDVNAKIRCNGARVDYEAPLVECVLAESGHYDHACEYFAAIPSLDLTNVEWFKRSDHYPDLTTGCFEALVKNNKLDLNKKLYTGNSLLGKFIDEREIERAKITLAWPGLKVNEPYNGLPLLMFAASQRKCTGPYDSRKDDKDCSYYGGPGLPFGYDYDWKKHVNDWPEPKAVRELFELLISDPRIDPCISKNGETAFTQVWRNGEPIAIAQVREAQKRAGCYVEPAVPKRRGH